MIETKSRKHGINFYKVWFAEDKVPHKGIISYRQMKKEYGNSEEFDTLITDLTEDPEEIKNRFAKNCKYEVNRASREDITVRHISAMDIKDEDIDSFIEFFKEFWESKDMELGSPDRLREEMISYRDIGALSYSIASVCGKDTVYHTYIYDENRVRLWHSASLYREESEDGNARKLTGFANRFAHYDDMLYFKDKGLKIYDWGGAGRGEDVINITRFKESFGGIAEKSYDYEEVRGFMAHTFRFIVSALDDVLLKSK